jgi:methylated-DNA-[protein]-cysteine S-methyltransferase
MTELHIDHVNTPLGPIALVTRPDGALCALDFADREPVLRDRLEKRFGAAPLRETENPGGHADRVRAYFEGETGAFEGAELEAGGSAFQAEVWAELLRVPAGETRSYSEIAAAIGRPKAVRAVGTANGRNPIALAIPCHRVITAANTLGGYAGGLTRKTWLLDHERH